MEVLEFCKAKSNSKYDVGVAQEYGINKSMLSKWKRQEKKIIDGARS